MINKLYSLYDRKVVNFSPPFIAPNHGGAIRMATDVARDVNTTVGRHPADFQLFCIGTFDDTNGLMLTETPIEHVVDVISLLPAPSEKLL